MSSASSIRASIFQAVNGIGIDTLREQLLQATGDEQSSTVISNARHKEALELALGDLRRATDALHQGEITGGTITSDEVLQNIFSHFCVGK